ncbi:MAG: phosphotransferase [Bacteroidales bacterium]|nr:phosphotransferase [Bacteroidales bacterium]
MAKDIIPSITALFVEWSGSPPLRVEALPGSGSARKYFRVCGHHITAMAAYSPDPEENKAFLRYTAHFRSKNLPVPEVYRVDEESGIYLLQDLGDTTLFDLIGKNRGQPEPGSPLDKLLLESLEILARFQTEGHHGMDYSVAYPRMAFDERSLMWDLNYFKYYFLKLLQIPFHEEKLENDFVTLSKTLLKAGSDFFMFRDFQSRNIMVRDHQLFFIDYQGGRRGPLQYDVASFLYQARAGFSRETRERLLGHYLETIRNRYGQSGHEFMKHFHGFILIRLLQALGAYGYRGYFERKPHFVRSIPPAVANLGEWLEKSPITPDIPALREALEKVVAHYKSPRPEKLQERLTVSIRSFSYMQGIPADPSGNGGGFVFDCRSLPNPGRDEKYRSMTGLDAPVAQYLQGSDEVKIFLALTLNLVSDAVSNYLERGFTSLMVNFGCTGGQHRSVYCAEALYRHLANRNDIHVEIEHTRLL